MASDTTVRVKPLALVVDDDASLRLTMRAALMKSGFDVVEAENGRVALDRFKSDRPDFIILDVFMPEMDGYATCAAIRSLPTGKYVQILMVTGLDNVDSIERAFEVGANEFVSKPINWQLLGYKGQYMVRAGRAFEELYLGQQRLAKTQEMARIGNWEVDLSSNVISCTMEACQLLSLEHSDRPISTLEFVATVIPEDRLKILGQIDVAVQTRRSFETDYQIVYEGEERHILNQAEVLYSPMGQPEMMLGAVQDVTKLKQAEAEIRQLAFYDSVTGLPNRTLFIDRLQQEINFARRHEQIFALLFLDLDEFKRINDTFGHHVGDILLTKVATTLNACLRESDSASRLEIEDTREEIARFGGDEYTVMLTNIQHVDNAAAIARRIVREIAAIRSIQGYEIAVTASVGISIFPTDGTEAEILLKNGDSAMYQAKNGGKNTFSFYDRSLNQVAIERFSLEMDMDTALLKDEFLLHYQPKIDLMTGEIMSVEALIRWMHPEKGLILPDDFIPIAEESGKIIDINKWVIHEACRQKRDWLASGVGPVNVAVNLSGYQLGSQDIVQVFKQALRKYSIDAHSLEVELTENVLMTNTGDILSTLRQMKEMEVKISLDDFGKGYSSLSYLTSFKVDTIKIDKSFVLNCVDNDNNCIIIGAIVAMGHSMAMRIIAEGIETEEQLELMKGFGVDEGQGFFFSRPVSHDELARMLMRGTL